MEFGAKIRDRITGFEGIYIGRTEYNSGCTQLLLQPHVDKDGKHVEGRWFDEQRCEQLAGDPITVDNAKTPGCDIPAPLR